MYFIYHRRVPTVDVTCNIRNMMNDNGLVVGIRRCLFI